MLLKYTELLNLLVINLNHIFTIVKNYIQTMFYLFKCFSLNFITLIPLKTYINFLFN